MNVDRQIGLLLPCNVTVRVDPNDDNAVIVDAINPQVMVELGDKPGMQAVADDVATKLRAAVESLTEAPQS